MSILKLGQLTDDVKRTAQAARQSALKNSKAGGGISKARLAALSGMAGAISGAIASSRQEARDLQQAATAPTPTPIPNNNPIIEDPIINLPSLVEPLEVEGELIPVEAVKSIDFVTDHEIPVVASVEPKRIVENYFDDDYRPVPIEAAIPIGSDLSVSSKAFNILESKVDFLAISLRSLMTRLGNVEDSIEDAILQNQNTLRENERRRDEEDVENRGSGESIFDTFAAAASLSGGSAIAKFVPSLMAFTAAAAFDDVAETASTTTPVGETLSPIGTAIESLPQISAAIQGTRLNPIAVAMAKDQLDVTKASVIRSISDSTTGKKVVDIGSKTKENISKIKNNAAELGQKLKASPQIVMTVRGLKTMQGWMRNTASIIKVPIETARAILGPIFKAAGVALKGLFTKPIKWLLIFESIGLTIKAGEALILNPSPEGEENFHSDVKKTINEVIDLIGGTYIGAMAGSLAAGAAGTITLPGIGTVAAGLVGAILGAIVGESLFKLIPIDVFVDAFYNYFILDRDNAFANIFKQMVTHVKNELKVLEGTVANVTDILTAGGIEMATVEEIADEYGDEAVLDPQSLVVQAMSGIGSDENAIAFALKDINTPEQFREFAERYEEKTGENFLEELRSELSNNELDKLEEQLKKQYEAHRGSVLASPNLRERIESGEIKTDSAGNILFEESQNLFDYDRPALESAIEKDIYNQDYIGSDEIDLDRLDELTPRELKAVIDHNEITGMDMRAVKKYVEENAIAIDQIESIRYTRVRRATNNVVSITGESISGDSELTVGDFVQSQTMTPAGISTYEVPAILPDGQRVLDLTAAAPAIQDKGMLIVPISMPARQQAPAPESINNPGLVAIDSARSRLASDSFLDARLQT